MNIFVSYNTNKILYVLFNNEIMEKLYINQMLQNILLVYFRGKRKY